MRIGVDLDGVVFNTEKVWQTSAELYDVIYLKRNSVIDRNEVRVQDKYAWTEEELQKFLDKYLYIEKFDIIPGSKIVLEKLHMEGHKIIFITARKSNAKTKRVTLKKLHDEKIKYDEIHWDEIDKVETCKNEKIDIMIDDYYRVCDKLSKAGIMTLCLNPKNEKVPENDCLKYVSNWGEIYRFIHDLKRKA